ncbi:MAG: hypothetical protein JW976_09520 [Syntrophaceae bacterium]|nr:hypothetical protein [Syntrophaceae bacterium]
MSVDPNDLTPSAIRITGSRLITQGMPMHFPTTSLDVFLPRVFAGTEITKEEIASYGEGGLCIDCKICTYPLCWFGTGQRQIG